MEDAGEPDDVRTACRETPIGRLEISGRTEIFDAAVEIALEAARLGETQGRFLDVAGRPAYFKGSPFRGRTRLRHAVRIAILRREAPRLRELRNLTWLRAHGFGAPEPLAAGLFRTMLGPIYQFLFTARIPAAVTLADFFREGPRALREPVLRSLADEVARLHAMGFIHHDLYPRNILVDAGEGIPRLFYIDAWRGGPPPQVRGPSYDLACLMLEGAELFSSAEQRGFFDAYFEAAGQTARSEILLRAVLRQRTALFRKLERKGRAPADAMPRNWNVRRLKGPGPEMSGPAALF